MFGRLKTICFMTVFLITSHTNGEEKSPLHNTTESLALTTEQSAIYRASAYLGLPRIGSTRVNKNLRLAKTVSMEEHSTRLFSNEIENKRAWKVVFDNVRLRFDSSSTVKPRYLVRDFSVYLDSVTGSLLRIVSQDMTRFKDSGNLSGDVKRYENSLISNSGEIEGLYGAVPAISFLEAIDWNFWYDKTASLIDGSCVLYSYSDQLKRPVWIVEFRDVQTYMKGGHVGKSICVIDATTGVWMSCTDSR